MSVPENRAGRIAALGWDPSSADAEPIATCNLCASTHLVEVARHDRYGFAQRFVICARCGLGFLSPRLTAAAYADFYDGTYRPLVSAHHGRLIDAVTVQDDQRGYAQELVEFLRASLTQAPSTVLDVGGSTGIVAAAARDAFAATATVLDPAPAELAVAAAAGMETIEGFAEDYDSAGRQWDLVLLCQTIDHLLDVRSTLTTLRALLDPHGHAFVDVLDLDFALRAKGTIEGAVKVDHPFYLTRHTAVAFFESTGYAVAAERMSDDGHWGFLLSPASATEPSWDELGRRADALLEAVWTRRAQR
jgi:2-polyprenyl-3-methyl-5-hydroxy-6-metoxy-1,4-benzoquinol methylase